MVIGVGVLEADVDFGTHSANGKVPPELLGSANRRGLFGAFASSVSLIVRFTG
jgi:hypothetical protein